MDHQEEEVNLPDVTEPENPAAEIKSSRSAHFLKHKRISVRTFISILLAFALGLSSGYFAWGRQITQAEIAFKPGVTPTAEHDHTVTIDMAAIAQTVLPHIGPILRLLPTLHDPLKQALKPFPHSLIILENLN